MGKRKITKLNQLKFKPFNKYGSPIKGWTWHNISFDKKLNFGTYVSRLRPGTRTLEHIHSGYEEFLILQGELLTQMVKFLKGLITYKPNSKLIIHKKRLFNFNFYERTQQTIKEKII